MKVKFLNNDGGGFAQEIELTGGEVSVSDFVGCYLNGDPSSYTLRVNSQPVAADTLLKDGDFVSALPAKIAGA